MYSLLRDSELMLCHSIKIMPAAANACSGYFYSSTDIEDQMIQPVRTYSCSLLDRQKTRSATSASESPAVSTTVVFAVKYGSAWTYLL